MRLQRGMPMQLGCAVGSLQLQETSDGPPELEEERASRKRGDAEWKAVGGSDRVAEESSRSYRIAMYREVELGRRETQSPSRPVKSIRGRIEVALRPFTRL